MNINSMKNRYGQSPIKENKTVERRFSNSINNSTKEISFNTAKLVSKSLNLPVSGLVITFDNYRVKEFVSPGPDANNIYDAKTLEYDISRWVTVKGRGIKVSTGYGLDGEKLKDFMIHRGKFDPIAINKQRKGLSGISLRRCCKEGNGFEDLALTEIALCAIAIDFCKKNKLDNAIQKFETFMKFCCMGSKDKTEFDALCKLMFGEGNYPDFEAILEENLQQNLYNQDFVETRKQINRETGKFALNVISKATNPIKEHIEIRKAYKEFKKGLAEEDNSVSADDELEK